MASPTLPLTITGQKTQQNFSTAEMGFDPEGACQILPDSPGVPMVCSIRTNVIRKGITPKGGPPLKALILLSHGSRRRESTDEMIRLAEAVAGAEHQPFDRVACAFQQFAAPSFQQALDDIVSEGATEVVVFPLFLAAGSHVLVDVPEMIAAARSAHPGVNITILPHLGQMPQLAFFLTEQAARHA
jgi:hypothetical protein